MTRLDQTRQDQTRQYQPSQAKNHQPKETDMDANDITPDTDTDTPDTDTDTDTPDTDTDTPTTWADRTCDECRHCMHDDHTGALCMLRKDIGIGYFDTACPGFEPAEPQAE